MRTASYFWVGSDTPVRGRQPSAWFPYNGRVSHEARTAQVIEWLKLPEERRPHLVTLYFSDVDAAGHSTGPNSAATRDAVHKVDRTIGDLLRALEPVRPALDILILSDHGMTSFDRVIDISDRADFTGVRAINEFTKVAVYSKDEARLRAMERSLKQKSRGEYLVYRRGNLPKHLHYRDNPRNGDLLILSTGSHGVIVRNNEEIGKLIDAGTMKGMHGFDPRVVTGMGGIFFAAGPTLRPGVRLGNVDNIGVFGLVARMLGVPIPAGADPGTSLARRLWRRRAVQ